MVDEREIRKQYSYKATSNLVIEQDRRRPREQSAGVVPLQTSNMPGKMGDRAGPSTRPEQITARIDGRKAQEYPVASGKLPDQTVLDVAKEFDLGATERTYVPTTRLSQKAFEALLAFALSKLGDQPRELLHSAVEEVLALMKDDKLQEVERKKIVEELFGSKCTGDEFTRLSMYCFQIKDYNVDADLAHELGAHPDDVLPVIKNIDDEDYEIAAEVVDLDDDVDKLGAPDFIMKDNTEMGNGDWNAMEKGAVHDSNDVDPRQIDRYWLERQVSPFHEDTERCQQLANQIFDLISEEEDDRISENKLVSLLGFDKFDFISLIIENRRTIVYCIRLARAEDEDDRKRLEEDMKSSEQGRKLLQTLKIDQRPEESTEVQNSGKESEKGPKKRKRSGGVHFSDEQTPNREPNKPRLRKLDIENLKFQRGGRLMTAKDCKLPKGSEHIQKKEYEEWHIPGVRATPSSSHSLVSVRSLPSWTQPVFSGTQYLNRMQSAVFPCAFETDENLLLCAPTGAGKTNVAILTILRCIVNAMPNGSQRAQDADLNSFKIVYVAPMKALVAEVVENLSKRLAGLDIRVSELTGDVGMSKHEIEVTQVIVTTPEKWDIITRKSGENAFTSLVRLLIVDEIHLLHDERGPVIESLVARTSRHVQSLTAKTRIVGLSATLPNYKDVATFLRVNPRKGLFYFDATYRPCPLHQCFIGITTKKALKRFQLMNELTYEKVKVQLKDSNQVIIFVHSRKETNATCRFIIEKAIEDEIIDQFLNPTSASYEIIQSELAGVNAKELSSILEHGLATHHAGMTRSDRHLVEALFEAGHIKVLVSTATLAWGVNLPAHAVIIKGTQMYSPHHGRWIELSSMDVMQMMGRAGRPQFDTYGEGYIITSKADVLYYLSVLNNQLPIESQFVSRLVDMVNAEVAIGSVSSITEGAQWLCYTYLYVRMVQNPGLYGIAVEEHHQDKALERRRAELIHAAANELSRCGLVNYNSRTGEITGTELGKVASDFYVSHESMTIYVEHMKSTTTEIDLLRIFSMSSEFQHMQVRDEEKLELARLAERVPIPIKESLEEATAKVSVLLQAYISRLGLDGLALKADMIYVTQSASRLTRALLEVAIQRKWAGLFKKGLSLCKSVDMRQWPSQTPLRQFGTAVGEEILHKLERKDIPFERYYDLTEAEVGELLRDPKLGRVVHRLVHSLPRMEVEANVRPLSRSTLEIQLTMKPDFRFDRKLHKSGEPFWIVVEDSDSDVLLHSELFFLRPAVAGEDHFLNFVVKLTTPQPPQYFVRCVSERWLAPATVLPLSFRDLLLPEKFAPYTKLLDLKPLSVDRALDYDSSIAIQDEEDQMAYREALSEIKAYFRGKFSHFTAIPSQLFNVLFESNANTVIASLPDAERDICGELCLARLFSRKPTATAVWVVGKGELAVNRLYDSFSAGLGKHLGLAVGKLISDRSSEVEFLKKSGALLLTTAERWDMFSRKWRQRREGRIMKKIALVILDGVHHLSELGSAGAAMEIVGSRSRYMAAEAAENEPKASENEPKAAEIETKAMRIVALCDPIANAKEIGHWLGAPPSAVFSFHPKEVCKDLKLDVVSSNFNNAPRKTRPASLARPVFTAIMKYAVHNKQPVLVFVASARLARRLALALAAMVSQTADQSLFRGDEVVSDTVLKLLSAKSLPECVTSGIAYIHESLSDAEQSTIWQLCIDGKCKVLVATSSQCWVTKKLCPRLVIVAGTSKDDDGAHATRRAEYSSSDLLRMISWTTDAFNPKRKRFAVIVTEPALRERYQLYTLEPFPAESQLPVFLADHFNAEIEAGVIDRKQDAVDYLTWTFFYRRLPKNPNYYGMNGVSHEDISSHLSELVESALSDLESSKCVGTEGEEDVGLDTLNLGRIAAHFYVRHATVELFASNIRPRHKLKDLIYILSSATEFDDVPVRLGDEKVLRSLATRFNILPDGEEIAKPHVKVQLLLLAQLNREDLPQDLKEDQKPILRKTIRLLRAVVNIVATAGWLSPALAAIELSQMLIQGLENDEYPIMQLPHIDFKIAMALKKKYEVTDVFDILNMAPSDRDAVLKSLTSKQIYEISKACQMFPNVDPITIESVKESVDGEGVKSTRVVVVIARCEEDDDDEGEGEGEGARSKESTVPLVSAPLYPEPKEEGWWVIVGDPKTNTLLNLKYLALKERATVKLDFDSPSMSGKQSLKLYLLSDSYIYCCQEESFDMNATANT